MEGRGWQFGRKLHRDNVMMYLTVCICVCECACVCVCVCVRACVLVVYAVHGVTGARHCLVKGVVLSGYRLDIYLDEYD